MKNPHKKQPSMLVVTSFRLEVSGVPKLGGSAFAVLGVLIRLVLLWWGHHI